MFNLNSKSEKYYKYKLIGICFIFLLSFKFLFSITSPFILGYLISLLLQPLNYFFINKFKIRNSISSLLCILSLLLILFILSATIFKTLQYQFEGVTEIIPVYIEEATTKYENFKQSLSNFFFVFNIFNILDFLLQYLFQFISNVAKNIVVLIPNIFLNFLIGVISSYFFIKDKELIKKFVYKIAPNSFFDFLNYFKKNIGFTLIAYLKAQLILMSITFLISFIGLSILNYKYSFLIALLIGLVDALPMFGSGFILWPLASYMIIVENYKMGVYLLIIYCIIFLCRQILEPKILGVQIGIHPLLILIGIYIGFNLLGIIGLIFGPLFIVLVKSIFYAKD